MSQYGRRWKKRQRRKLYESESNVRHIRIVRYFHYVYFYRMPWGELVKIGECYWKAHEKDVFNEWGDPRTLVLKATMHQRKIVFDNEIDYEEFLTKYYDTKRGNMTWYGMVGRGF